MDLFPKDKKEIKRIKTHIKGIDENLEGGIPEQHIVLVNGTSGSMKSSVCFNILYNEAALNGKTGLYITLEQSGSSILKHMVNMDFDLSKINLVLISDIAKLEQEPKKIKNKKGTIIIADLGSIRKSSTTKKEMHSYYGIDWLSALRTLTSMIANSTGCELFVLDSITAFYSLSKYNTLKFKNPRAQLFFIFEFLRDLGLTSYMISEMPSDKARLTENAVEEYLADGILHLQLTERYRKVTREISIVKMRATNCNNDIFTLEYKNKEFYAIYGGKTPLV